MPAGQAKDALSRESSTSPDCPNAHPGYPFKSLALPSVVNDLPYVRVNVYLFCVEYFPNAACELRDLEWKNLVMER